jgi:hypothetical protein
MGNVRVFAGVLLVSLAARSAVAETISDRASFNAAAGSLTTLDFEGIARDGWYKFFGGVTLSGVTFTGQNTGSSGTVADVWVMDDTFSSGNYTTGTGAALIGGMDTKAVDGVLTATFGAGVRAIGTDFTTQVATSYAVTLSDGTIISGMTPGLKKSIFVGIIADHDIASISFTNRNGGYASLDNFSFGAGLVKPVIADAVHAVPLPTAAWGGLALLAGLGVTRRLRRSAALDATA